MPVVRIVRRLDIFVVLVALLLAAQPLLHNHPLGGSDAATTNASTTCAVCATGIGRLPTTAPTLTAPPSILYTLDIAPVAAVPTITPFTRDSRGPPAT
jgi:hypothetical protein